MNGVNNSKNQKRNSLRQKMSQCSHLKNYMDNFQSKGNPLPNFVDTMSEEHREMKDPNIVYQISDDIFIHINSRVASDDGYNEYVIIEPDEPDSQLLELADKMFASNSKDLIPPKEITEKYNMIDEYAKKYFIPVKSNVNYTKIKNPYELKKLNVNVHDLSSLHYHFLRKRAGLGILEPFLKDPNLEDISIVGTGNLYVIHKMFGSLKSSVFLSGANIDELVINLSEQFGKTISHSKPIVDATLPEGSRINIVYGKDISRKGTNATIRRFSSTPLSITQLLKSKTWSYEQAAYMWMMLDEGLSIFINGETASGKTTSLMALAPFIPSNWKICSIEDTPEITLPHVNWLNETTRDTGNESSSITLFDLLKAALRQRPNYILVGEIRGAEGSTAFQAMQTGHPVISTFHSHNMTSLIQRLTNEPINIPKTHIENLNIAIFQSSVLGPDGKRARRVTSINEVVGYNSQSDGIMFVTLFEWDSATDTVKFRGKGSSTFFTKKLLPMRGLGKKDEMILYDELILRSNILKKMVEKKIFNFYEVFESIAYCKKIGLEEFMNKLEMR